MQLPPEYDPLRHYPTIVTLADAGVSPEQMLDFWAGPADKEKGGERLGQATRHGYIVIAVDWQQPHQFTYDYSAREHHAVLGALRDACRRFSIDTDRVFLTGHGIGGDAAWDIALAHPDLWAGVIPIVAVADRYRRPLRGERRVRAVVRRRPASSTATRCRRNAARARSLLEAEHATSRSSNTWAAATSRSATRFSGCSTGWAAGGATMPKEIECVSMRPWDNFFWWLEVEGLPEKSMVPPGNWPPPQTRPAGSIRGQAAGKRTRSPSKVQAEKATVWLSPELVDFNEQTRRRSQQPRDLAARPHRAAGFERAAGRRPHAGRPAASVLGEAGRRSRVESRESRARVGWRIAMRSFRLRHSAFDLAYGASLFSTAPVTNQPSFSLRTTRPCGAEVAADGFEVRQAAAVDPLLARWCLLRARLRS